MCTRATTVTATWKKSTTKDAREETEKRAIAIRRPARARRVPGVLPKISAGGAKETETTAACESRFAPCRRPLAVWQLGEDLTLVALAGEVVVDYVTLLERSIGWKGLWVVAYANDVFGYLPSKKVIAEGGYETRGLYAGGIGFFAPAAEDRVVEKVRELARDAGRKLPAAAAAEAGD